MYKLNFIRSSEFIISKWSGGKTTELAIYPPKSIYANRDFIWRISSASVEIEESTFTKLESYKRIIMILSGKLELSHTDHHNVLLNEYDQDSFSGSWETKSLGKVVDYNLMMKENCYGHLNHVNFSKKLAKIDINFEKMNLDKNKYENYTKSIYCYEGDILVKVFGVEYNLLKGDFLQIDFDEDNEFIVEMIDNTFEGSNVISTFVAY